MSDQAYAERLARAIEKTGLATPVNVSHGENQVTVLCRVRKGAEAAWQEVLKRIHRSMKQESKQAHAWRTHTCKDHFIMEKGGQEQFGYIWHISITSALMKETMDYVSAAIRGEQIQRARPGEVTEMPFTGLDPSYQRNMPGPKGKGVYTVGGTQDFRVGRR